jgi:hypothetical protein
VSYQDPRGSQAPSTPTQRRSHKHRRPPQHQDAQGPLRRGRDSWSRVLTVPAAVVDGAEQIVITLVDEPHFGSSTIRAPAMPCTAWESSPVLSGSTNSATRAIMFGWTCAGSPISTTAKRTSSAHGRTPTVRKPVPAGRAGSRLRPRRRRARVRRRPHCDRSGARAHGVRQGRHLQARVLQGHLRRTARIGWDRADRSLPDPFRGKQACRRIPVGLPLWTILSRPRRRRTRACSPRRSERVRPKSMGEPPSKTSLHPTHRACIRRCRPCGRPNALHTLNTRGRQTSALGTSRALLAKSPASI